MVRAEDSDKLFSKRKAIMALLPYMVWQERDGQPEMFYMLQRAAGVSRTLEFTWHHVEQFAITLLSKATPRAIVLASPHIPWSSLAISRDLVRKWAAATSAVSYTEEVAQSVVNTLLWIASLNRLSPHITADVWLWLKRQPQLPPVCLGRRFGTSPEAVKVVRGLKDIEVLKSYLLIVWSEWSTLWDDGSKEICASIREDFCGIGMGCHRADLIQRLDDVLGQLDRELEYLQQHSPGLRKRSVNSIRHRYRQLRGTLLDVDAKAIARTSSYYPMVLPFCVLIQVGICRISCNGDIYVCASSPMSIISCLEPSFPTTASLVRRV